MKRAAAIDAARFDQRVLGLAAICTAVHPQRTADRSRNTAQEGKPGDAGFLRRARDFHIRNRRPGADPHTLNGNLAEAAAEPHHHARNATVANDEVGAQADRGDGDVAGQLASR